MRTSRWRVQDIVTVTVPARACVIVWPPTTQRDPSRSPLPANAIGVSGPPRGFDPRSIDQHRTPRQNVVAPRPPPRPDRRICRRPGDEPAAPTGSRWATAHLPTLDWPDGPCHGRGRERCTNRGRRTCDIVLSSWSRQALRDRARHRCSGDGSQSRQGAAGPGLRHQRVPGLHGRRGCRPVGHGVPEQRGRALDRCQPDQIPPTWLGSGSRTAGPTAARGGSWPVSASTAERAGSRSPIPGITLCSGGAVAARRLPALHRPVGQLRPRRDPAPAGPVLQRRRPAVRACRLRPRLAGQPLDRRRV